MTEDEVKELVKQYIKDNLSISVGAECGDYYGKGSGVRIKVYLEGEVVAEDWCSL